MDGKIVTKSGFILLLILGTCRAGGCSENLAGQHKEEVKTNQVESILKQLNEATFGLKTYQSDIEYLFSQPLLDPNVPPSSLRTGDLYYAKFGEESKLRIHFKTLQEDDEEEQKYIEQYIFDGVWLTHIDYENKHVQKRQLAEENEPVDAFELARRYFPIIGFNKSDELKDEFEIELVEKEEGGVEDFIRLHLKVKPDSIYKDDYTTIDFWIDEKLFLPVEIVAVTTEEDIYRIEFIKAEVNRRIEKKVFDFKVPKGFGEPEIIPLKNEPNGK